LIKTNVFKHVTQFITKYSDIIMKHLFLILLSLLVLGNVFVSCKDEKTDFTELGKDEYPQIFGQWPDKKSNGDLGEFNLTLGDTLKPIVQYTPSRCCEGIWYVDGVEVHRGIGYTYVPTTQGKFNIKLVVKTPKYETVREAIISVVEPTS